MFGYKYVVDIKYVMNLEWWFCRLVKEEVRCYLRFLVCFIKEFFNIMNGSYENVLSIKW